MSEIPPGWRLVPIQPTDDMLDELCCAMDRYGWPVHAKMAWEAVLSVVPEVKNDGP